MGKRKTAPLDVALDELVPCRMRNRSVIPATRAEMHNVSNPGLSCVVQQRLDLPEHIDRVAGHEKMTVTAVQSRQVSAFVIQIESDACDAPGCKGRRFLRRS